MCSRHRRKERRLNAGSATLVSQWQKSSSGGHNRTPIFQSKERMAVVGSLLYRWPQTFRECGEPGSPELRAVMRPQEVWQLFSQPSRDIHLETLLNSHPVDRAKEPDCHILQNWEYKRRLSFSGKQMHSGENFDIPPNRLALRPAAAFAGS